MVTTPTPPPPVSALFLIEFDVKAGYTLLWHQTTTPAIPLTDLVEYKSLPSGLHFVPRDLIYFVHPSGHAGLSAFVNRPVADTTLRGARMLAVGVLVPLSYGRLGRAWRHTKGIQRLAEALVEDKGQTGLLEQYWAEHGEKESEPVAAKSHGRAPSDGARIFVAPRRIGTGTEPLSPVGAPGAKLEKDHPAHSLTRLLDVFGPLIFPLFRAAILRKRILISCNAPVHQVNDFVYDLSILSNIPSPLVDILPETAPVQRLRPLFTIGIHDIPLLETHLSDLLTSTGEDPALSAGWIACTTDSILAMKENLWDILVTMPPTSLTGSPPIWPIIQGPKGIKLKATQRDLRRYISLKTALSRITSSTSFTLTPYSDIPNPTQDLDLAYGDSHPTSPSPSIPTSAVAPPEASDPFIATIVEPTTWTALAYSGFMWWASAGEQRNGDALDEAAADSALLADLLAPAPGGATGCGAQGMTEDDEGTEARVELAIVAYFHRLTTQILSVGAEVVSVAGGSVPPRGEGAHRDSDSDSDPEEEVPEDEDASDEAPLVGDHVEPELRMGNQVLEAMGLDIWSAVDAEFARRVLEVFFDRRAFIETKGVEVCGVRVC